MTTMRPKVGLVEASGVLWKKLIVSILIGVLMLSPIAYAKEYQLIPGDTLEIKIINHQSLDTKQAIAPDGTVSLPLLGRVQAEGESLEGFQSNIQKQFTAYIQNPQIVMYVAPVKEKSPTADAKPEPIFIIINDIGKKTFEVKKAATVIEARAMANNYEGEIKPGDIINVKVGKEISFWQDNWYALISATVLVAGFIARNN